MRPSIDLSGMGEPARDELVEMAMGYMRGKVLAAAVRLGLADAFAGPMTVVALADAIDCDPAAVERLVRALESIGIVCCEDGMVMLTDLGARLRRDQRDSAWASVVFWADLLADSWNYLDEVVRTGSHEAVAEAQRRNGSPSRWSFEADPLGVFNRVFAELDADANRDFVHIHAFSRCAMVADLGGGGGGLLEAVLLANPEVRGILVDRPEAIDGARARLAGSQVSDRIDFVTGDLFEGVTVQADAFLMRNVLHVYDDALAEVLLRNCHAAMRGDDRLIIIEPVIPDSMTPGDTDVESIVMSDLNMMVVTGGRERTIDGWRRLVAAAGFELESVQPVPADGHYTALTARP
jgi:SAM-dependent methyltransferase